MNTKKFTGRLLAVGDIHGFLDKLVGLMEKVAPTENDCVIFLGDYINRGPDSRGVIEYLIEFARKYPQTFFLRGNHDQMLLDAKLFYMLLRMSNDERKEAMCSEEYIDLFGRSYFLDVAIYDMESLFFANGGETTLRSYGGSFDKIPREHLAFLESTRFVHIEQVENPEKIGSNHEFFFVHAGFLPGIPLAYQNPMEYLWVREPFLSSRSRFGGRVVVHGHSPDAELRSRKHRICVDSGVYMTGRLSPRSKWTWGKLTCCDVLTRRVWQAE